MKRTKRLLLAVACIGLLVASWLTAVMAKSDADKQRELIEQAAAYTEDEIYILAVPLLEEAAGYQDDYTLEAETALKKVYLALEGKSNFSRRYKDLLDKQMGRADVAPEIFEEAAQYYLERGKTKEALSVLRNGAVKTGSDKLEQIYEDNRYVFTFSRDFYEEAAPIHAGMSQVSVGGRWGLASSSGLIVVPCEYDKISNFDGDRAVVMQDSQIFAVDMEDNRVALLHTDAVDFGSYGDQRIALKTADGWILSTGEFQTGSTVFEELGMFSDGCAPARLNGKWGLLKTNGVDWELEPQYDGIICDELGRCYNQKSVFVRKGGEVWLIVGGEETAGPYEDACPFNGGWAAVKQNGKWGFIDTTGTVQIDFQFAEARSFGEHLAAVCEAGQWGYVSLKGKMAIEPQFDEAWSFSGGSAPVKTNLGWQFITLTESEGGGGLF